MINNFGPIEAQILNDISRIDFESKMALRSIGEIIEQEAKLRAPRRTGTLQQSIESRQIENEVSIFVDNASPAGSYAKFVHDNDPFIETAFEEKIPEFESDLLNRLDRIFN